MIYSYCNTIFYIFGNLNPELIPIMAPAQKWYFIPIIKLTRILHHTHDKYHNYKFLYFSDTAKICFSVSFSIFRIFQARQFLRKLSLPTSSGSSPSTHKKKILRQYKKSCRNYSILNNDCTRSQDYQYPH